MLTTLQQDPSSRYFNPYSKATNRAVYSLQQNWGIDTNQLTEDWFTQNTGWQDYLIYNGTTTTPSKPGKRATQEQKFAYDLFQYRKSMAQTAKVEQEWQAMQEEVAYKAKSGRYASEQAIIDSLDMDKKYKTLKSMKDSTYSGSPMELNKAIGYSEDALYGTIWAAMNDQPLDGNMMNYMANSYLGTGKKFSSNAETLAKLNPASEDYAPYSAGMTATEEGLYFNMQSFPKGWVEENKYRLNSRDETERENYINVAKAEETTVDAETALESLQKNVDSWLESGLREQDILKNLDSILTRSDYAILAKMDQTMDDGYNLVETTRPINYRKQDIIDYIHNACTEAGKKQSAVDMAGEIFGAGVEAAVAGGMAEALPTPQGMLDTASSVNTAAELPENSPSESQPQRSIQDIMAEAASLAGISRSGQQNVDPESIAMMRTAYDEKNGAGSFDADMNAVMSTDANASKPTMGQGPDITPQTAAGSAANVGSAPVLSDKSRSIAWKAPDGVTLLTKSELEEMKQKDQNVAEASMALEGKANETESAYFAYTSQGSAPVQEYLSSTPAEELAGTNILTLCQDYSNEMIGLFITDKKVTHAKKALEEAQAALPELEQTIASISNGINASDDELEYMNGLKRTYMPSWIYEAAALMDNSQASSQEKTEALLDVYRMVSGDDEYQYDETAGEKTRQAEEWLNYLTSDEMVEHGIDPEDRDRLPRLNELKRRYEETITTSQETIDRSSKDQKRFEERNLWLDETIKSYEAAGIDATDLKAAKAVTSFLGDMSGYQYVRWGNTGYYQELADEGKSKQEIQQEHETFQQKLDNARWALEYVSVNKIQLPDDVRKGIEDYILDLEANEKDYDYYMKRFSEGFEGNADKGRELEKKNYNVLSDGLAIVDRNDILKGKWNIAAGLENAYYSRFMTEEEKNTFYALYGEGGEKEGKQLAWEYYKHLAYDTRVLQARDIENTEEQAQNEVDSGLLGATWANVKAIGSSFAEGLSGLSYSLEAALNISVDGNSRIAENDPRLRMGKYSAKVYESTLNAIHNEFKDKPVWDTVFSGLYEAVYNQGRSTVNSVLGGGLTRNISNPVIQEILGAMNMASGAMAMTISDATEKGASKEQALALGGITLIAESFSEGLTASNIHSMITGIDAGDFTGVKDALVEWLTQAGFEEAAGEVANSVIEDHFDKSILGGKSEHEERVNNWYAALKKENPNLQDDEIRIMAEEAAEKDELSGYIHTALISYLSPGLNTVTGLVKSSTEHVMEYRRTSRAFQNAGMQDMGITEVREMYRAREEQLNNQETEEQAPTDEQGQAPAAAAEQEQGQTAGQAPEAAQGDIRIANPASAPVNPAAAVTDDTFVKDASVLNSVAGKSATVGTAAITSILNNGTDRRSAAAAKAAAVSLNKTLGGADNAMNTVKTILAGAKTAGVGSASVKSAIQIAALAPHSRTAMFLNSETFENATPAQKAQILADLGQQDAKSGAVMDEMNSTVKEGIVADLAASILANGAGKPAIEAREKMDAAAKERVQAERDLEDKQGKKQAALDAVSAANAEMDQDVENATAMMGEALDKLRAADEVEKEYDQRAEKARQKEEQVNADGNRTIDETMTNVRNQAEQAAAQQAEQEAQAEAEAAARAEEARQEQERLQAEEDQRSGKAWEQNRDDMIEQILDQEYLEEGEVREKRRQELTERANQIKLGRIDMAGMMNNTEGFLAVSAIGRRLNLGMKLSDSLPDSARGMYKDGVVYLNSNLIKNGKLTIGQALVEASLHEITHAMESTRNYQTYRDTVVKALFGSEAAGNVEDLYENNRRFRAAIDQKIADYRKSVHQELSIEDAEREIVADFARTKLNEKEVVQRFLDAGLGGKMRNTLHNINQALKNFKLKGEEKTTAEYLRRAERTFQKMINEAEKMSVHPEGGQFSVAQIAQATGMTFDDKTLTLYDAKGNVVDGVNNRITSDMIGQTPVGLLITNGLSDQSPGVDENGNAKPSPRQAAMEMMAGLMNMVARYKDSNLIWEIGASTLSSTFSALKSNSDPQYATTVDFGTVCAKTQAIIDVMSQVMLDRVKEGKTGGLTRDEIMKVYNETHNAGLSVPCPVCYVFSRWMGVPSLLGQMSQYQHDYVVTNEDGSINKEATQAKADEYIRNAEEKYGDAKAINNKKTQLQNQLAKLEEQRTKATTDEERQKILDRMVELDQQIGEVSAYNWVTQALCKKEKGSGKYVVDPKFKVTPDEILFDLNRTGEFAGYEKNWRYRNTRGAGMGKAIMPYSGESIGDILYGVKAKGRQNTLKNPWLNMDPKAAARQLSQARTRAKKQNLVGGQRLQSTSDFRPEWGLDYIMSFLELQAAGSKTQMYTKVPEAVDFFASVGADVNLSIMGKGQGWHVDENGNKVLDFSSITGMDYETAKALKNKYDNVQMILVGMNDTHIRLAMANDDIDFIIPWHSSGNSKDVLAGLISSVGEKLDSSVDYSSTQTDSVSTNRTAEQKQLWDARVKLLTKGGDALSQEERSLLLSNPFTADLYKRFTQKGVDPDCYGVKLNKAQANQIFPYEYWDTLSTKENADVNGQRFVEYCEAMGIVPRFSQFKDDPGYWKLLIDRPMYNNDGSYHQQQVIDVTNARIGALDESGKLTDSDLPTKAQAKYASKDPRSEHYAEYTAKEQQAIENAKAALDEQYDDGTNGQYSTYGDMTTADMEQMLSETSEDYQSAVERGDMEAAAEDVESYAASKGYTLETFHGTGEYFNTFRRGYEGIHLGNREQAEEVADNRYEWRSKNSIYKWSDVRDNVESMDTEQRESLVRSAYMYQDYFDDGQAVPEFDGDISDADAVREYAESIYQRYAAVTGRDPGSLSVNTRTFDRKTGKHVMHLYARINNPFVINGDIGQWDPASIAGVILRKADGETTATSHAYGEVDITGSDVALNEDQRAMLEKLNSMEIEGQEEKWDALSGVLDQLGFDGIQYLNEYEGDKNSYSYIALRQSDVKSADTVTYDDQGNVIPLSERFTDSPDIRYSADGTSLTDLEQMLSETNVPYTEEGRIDQFNKSVSSVSNLLQNLSESGSLPVRTVIDSFDRKDYPTLYQWLHNTFEKGDRAGESVKNADLEAFLRFDEQQVKDGAKSVAEGWHELVSEHPSGLIPLDVSTSTTTDGGFSSRIRAINTALFGNGKEATFINADTGASIAVDDETIRESFAYNKTAKQSGVPNKVLEQVLRNTGTLIENGVYIGSHVNYADRRGNVHYIVSPITIDGYTDAAVFAVHDKTTRSQKHNERAYVTEVMVIENKNAPGSLRTTSETDAAVSGVTPSGISSVSIGKLLDSVNSNRIRFFDKDDLSGRQVQFSAGGENTLADLDQQLVGSGIISQEDIDAYNGNNGITPPTNGLSTNVNPEDNGPGRRQFGTRTAQESDALHDEVKDYLYTHSQYTPESNQEQIDRATDWVRSMANDTDPDGYRSAVDEVTSDSFDYRSADGQARMLTVMGMAALKNDIDTEMRLADAYNRQGTDLGRALQSRKIFRLMTPVGRISYFQKQVDNLNRDIGKKTGKTGTIRLNEWTVRAIGAAETEEDFAKIRKAVSKEIGEQIPANWKDKLRSWRMLAMLGNPRTHIRNIIGNAMFIPAVSLKNKLGAVAELGMEKGNRTKTISPVLRKDVRDFARQDAIAMRDTLTGEAKYNEEDLIQQNRRQFKGVFQALSDFNSNALEGEDWFFLKGHYRRALGGWMQANGYTAEQMQNNPALLEKGREYAVKEAQKATYRDFNGVAKKLNELSQNPQTFGQKVLGFGVEAVLPFKKTPANILKRGIEYSPVGIARALTTDLYHLKQWNDYQNGKLDTLPEGAISPNQFIDDLCSGLTGTAIMAVGALFGNMGVVSCGLDDDDDEFEKLRGNQEYAVKFSIGGNDYTFTMDWAAPMCMPFFVGAAIQEQMANQEGFSIDELINAMGNITEPVFNLSMLDGVNSLLDMFTSGDDTNATITQLGAKIASNYATSYIPSILGATARTIDPYRRKSFVESGKGTGILGTARYAREQVENKIPGLSQTNIPYRDVWGNAEESGLAERILENFVLPGYINQYRDDPIVGELERIGKAPKEPGKTISNDGEKYILTDKQWDTYKTERGQTAYNLLGEMMNTETYQAAKDDEKAALIDAVWDYANKRGQLAAVPEVKVDDWIKTSKDPVGDIIEANNAKIQKKRVSANKENMITSLENGNTEGFEAMIEALRQDGVKDDTIRDKIRDTYRDQYKDAYRKDDSLRMDEIAEKMKASGLEPLDKNGDIKIFSNWEKAADKEEGEITRSMPTESDNDFDNPRDYLAHLMELDEAGTLDDVSMEDLFNTVSGMSGGSAWAELSDVVGEYVDFEDPNLETSVAQLMDYLYDHGYTEADIFKQKFRMPNVPLRSREKRFKEGKGVSRGELYNPEMVQSLEDGVNYMNQIANGAVFGEEGDSQNSPQQNIQGTFNGDLSSVPSYSSNWLPYYPYKSQTPVWDEDAPDEAKQGL